MNDNGYTLDLAPGGAILAAGPPKVRRALLYLPGVETATGAGRPLSIPAARENFLAVEAVAAPTAVSDAYRRAREEYLRPPMSAIGAMASQLAELSVLGQPNGFLPHQWQFLAHAYSRNGIINASEQGTGKTRPAWLLAHLWEARRILIVCPKSLASQWQQEWKEMWLGAPPHYILPLTEKGIMVRRAVVDDLRYTRCDTFCPVTVIVNYEVLDALEVALSEWQPDLVILDESWRVKNPAAKVTKAALKLTDAVHARDGHVVLLSGTPIANNVGDLYTQIRMADPALVDCRRGAHGRFLQRYAEMVLMDVRGFREYRPAGCADPAGLMRLMAPVWFRATKAGCLQLPPKHYRRVKLPLPRETAALYHEVARDGAAALGAPLCLDGEQTTLVHLQRLTSGFKPVPADEHGRAWEHDELPCPKLEWLEQWAGDTLAGDPTHRAIVWCRFTADVLRVWDVLGRKLGFSRVADIYGKTPARRLEWLKETFNSRDPDEVQVIIAQWSKLAYGHNLQACDTNVFFSHTWSYIERAQAEDRSHRHGRADAVEYIELVAVDPEKDPKKRVTTIDEMIVKAVESKRDLAELLTPETACSVRNQPTTDNGGNHDC